VDLRLAVCNIVDSHSLLEDLGRARILFSVEDSYKKSLIVFDFEMIICKKIKTKVPSPK